MQKLYRHERTQESIIVMQEEVDRTARLSRLHNGVRELFVLLTEQAVLFAWPLAVFLLQEHVYFPGWLLSILMLLAFSFGAKGLMLIREYVDAAENLDHAISQGKEWQKRYVDLAKEYNHLIEQDRQE